MIKYKIWLKIFVIIILKTLSCYMTTLDDGYTWYNSLYSYLVTETDIQQFQSIEILYWSCLIHP